MILSKYALGDKHSTGEMFGASFVTQANGNVQVQIDGKTQMLRPLDSDSGFYRWEPLEPSAPLWWYEGRLVPKANRVIFQPHGNLAFVFAWED